MEEQIKQAMTRFLGKAFIKGSIVVKTGLHIGGSKTSLDIGGLDLSVIKTAEKEVPFIPGSSLKGKLRSLLAREVGSQDVDSDLAYHADLFEIFGFPASNTEDEPNGGISQKYTSTRLLVRDAFLNTQPFKDEEFQNLDFEYTEEKWENTIDRRTGKALHPRQLERVPAGAEFTFSMVYNVFDDFIKQNEDQINIYKCNWHLGQIRKAMKYLEDDYLGGHGSRGYGQISFKNVELSIKKVADYETNAQNEPALISAFWESDQIPEIHSQMNLK